MVSNRCFQIGDMISSQSGISLKIINFIGEGGQGEVYEVESGGNRWALKYYTKETFATPELRKNIRSLIDIGSPDKTFLWPFDIVEKPDDLFFGYIMPLRAENFFSLIDYVKRRINPSFYSIITAAYNLAESFSKLHALGLCYRDISLGNVFFDPDIGDVMICDNDNVCYNNNSHSLIGVGGTAGFVAPEIVMGKKIPSRNTDLYSLSVLLFHLLCIAHPLNGLKEANTDCWDDEIAKKIHGAEAVFIFDPNNDTNRPDPNIHQNALLFWNLYPNSVKQFFIQAFTEGISDPDNGRVRENEWKGALIHLRDSLFHCQHCDGEVFFDYTMMNDSLHSQLLCWRCKKPVTIPPMITIGANNPVLLNENTILFFYHLNPSSFDMNTPIARVSKHPSMERYGLQNLTSHTWTVTSPDGMKAEVTSQKNALIGNGILIDFGSVKGKILAK